MMMSDGNDLDLIPLRSPECYRELPVSVTRLYQLIKLGELEAVKLGSRTFFRRGELRRFKAGLPRLVTAKRGVA